MEPPLPIDVIPNSQVGFAASAAVVQGKRPLWASLLEGIAFGLLLIAVSTLLAGRNGLIGAFVGYVFTWTWLYLIRTLRVRRRLGGVWNVPPYRLSIDARGVTAASETGSVWRAWSRASDLSERPEWVAITFDGREVTAIPASSFPNEEARDAWLQYVRANIGPR